VKWWTKPIPTTTTTQKKKGKRLAQAGDSAMVLVIRRPLIATLTKFMENKNGDEDPHESHKPKYKYFAN
jgi:hypothetical protein